VAVNRPPNATPDGDTTINICAEGTKTTDINVVENDAANSDTTDTVDDQTAYRDQDGDLIGIKSITASNASGTAMIAPDARNKIRYTRPAAAGLFVATASVASADNHWDGSATFEGSVDDGAPIDSKTISQDSGDDVTIKLTNLSDNNDDGELDSVTIKVHDTALTINNTDDEGKTYDVAGETVEFASLDTTDRGDQYVVTFGLLYDPAPVCGPVSLSNNDSLNAYAYCNDGGGDDCKTSDRQSTTATHEFSGGNPLPKDTTVDVAIDLSVEAVNYDSRANANTTISLLDYSGDTIDEKDRSISVDNPPEDDVTNRATTSTTVSFSDAGGATQISVDQSVFAGAGPGGGGSGHDSTNASADASAVDVTVTSPSCGNNDLTADNDGTVDAGICADKDGLEIDVLDNDGDDNGNNYDKSNITITKITQEASKGTTQIFEDDNGVDKISYTPHGNATGTDSFAYEAEFPDGITDTATVTVNVASCGEIRVSFEGGPGGTADPTYTHASTTNLPARTAASSGDELVWNVPLEVATNTAELKPEPNYIEPPEGYQIEGNSAIFKETETGEDFTGENTSVWLGEDYEAETPTVTCYSDQDGDGFGNPDTDTQRDGDSCPTGEVQNGDDCYDQNADANPDQESFFANDRGDGSFDYNCNGTADKEYTKTYNEGASCEKKDSGPDCEWSEPDNVSTGWQESVPDCGDSGTYYTTVSCSGECADPDNNPPPCESGPPVCSINRNTEQRTQSCR
jgi:hypothetical protein